MDEVWVGTISALGGAIVAGVISLLRDRRAEQHQAARDTKQRSHEVIERRFDARREAYVGFAAAFRSVEAGTLRFEEQYGCLPGDMHEDLAHPSVEDALAMLQIVGPPDVIEVAERAAQGLFSWAFGIKEVSHANAQAAFLAYNEVARKTLKFDEAS